jgi:hypothetical protein
LNCIASTAILALAIPCILVWKNYDVNLKQNKGKTPRVGDSFAKRRSPWISGLHRDTTKVDLGGIGLQGREGTPMMLALIGLFSNIGGAIGLAVGAAIYNNVLANNEGTAGEGNEDLTHDNVANAVVCATEVDHHYMLQIYNVGSCFFSPVIGAVIWATSRFKYICLLS